MLNSTSYYQKVHPNLDAQNNTLCAICAGSIFTVINVELDCVLRYLITSIKQQTSTRLSALGKLGLSLGTQVMSNLTELAKQGNPEAIATLLSRSLNPKGVTVKTALKDGCLQVILEAEQVPEQKSLVDFIHKGLVKLEVKSISKLRICGRVKDGAAMKWSQQIQLNNTGSEVASDPPKKEAEQSKREKQIKTLPPKFLIGGLVGVSLLFAAFNLISQPPNNPEETVSAYIRAITKNDEQFLRDYRCHADKKDRIEGLPVGVISWEITGKSQESMKRDADAQYTVVSAKIKSQSTSGFPVSRTWQFEVWQPEELFEFVKRLFDNSYRMSVQNEEILRRASATLGKPYEERKIEPHIPTGKGYSTKPYCVLQVRE